MKKIKIAINGMGRIGKCIFRAIHELNQNIEITAINVGSNIQNCSQLLKYDSVHGTFPFSITQEKNELICNNQKTKLYQSRDLSEISWQDIDFVMECSGAFKNYDKSQIHLNLGAKNVIISSPAKNVKSIIYGVNHQDILQTDKILSASSCTTNCLAPLLYILNKNFTITNAHFTTIHAYTNDQNILDKNHKDIRRSRACGLSIIPTTTGASSSINEIIPSLSNKIFGTSLRVPVPNVSLIDLSFHTKKDIEKEKIHQIFTKESHDNLKNIINICNEELVSIDFMHSPYSAIIDSSSITKINNNFGRIAAWYDNEWSFALRMIDIANYITRQNKQ